MDVIGIALGKIAVLIFEVHIYSVEKANCGAGKRLIV